MSDRPEVQKKTCPQCKGETFDFLNVCPACGFRWPDLERLRTPREPGRRMLASLAVLLAVLLGSLCVLYALLLSFSGRPAP